MWDSITKLLSLPSDTRLYVGHDYCPGGRERCFETTIGDERERSIHVKSGTKKESFIEWRKKRDASLGFPRLLLPAIQVNIRGGMFPEAEEDGVSFLKIPLNKIGRS